MVTHKTAKENKVVTLAEFKAWLEGIEELAGANWVPDGKQWKRIRTKIELIREPNTAPARAFQAPPMFGNPSPHQVPDPQFVQTVPRSQLTPILMPVGRGGRPPIAVAENVSVKTPDIDTTDGQYDSPFG